MTKAGPQNFHVGLRFAGCLDHGPFDPSLDSCPRCPPPTRIGVVTHVDHETGVITIDSQLKETPDE